VEQVTGEKVMSVNQMKLRFDELKTYLGRDEMGQAKLTAAKEAANIVRKAAAAAVAETERLREHLESVNTERLKMQQKIDEMQVETHRLQQHCRSLEGAITRVDKPKAKQEPVPSNKDAAMKVVLQKLRTRQKYCPQCIRVTKLHGDRLEVYERNSLSDGWDHQDLWQLGANVALLVAMSGQICVTSDQRLPPGTTPGKGQLLRWFSKNVNWDEDAELQGKLQATPNNKSDFKMGEAHKKDRTDRPKQYSGNSQSPPDAADAIFGDD
jgi:hypothetical protein